VPRIPFNGPRCPRCNVRPDLCICAHIPRITPPARVVIVRHRNERWKSTNSAPLALAALEGARLVEWAGRGAPYEAPDLPAGRSYLLMPGPDARPAATLPAGACVVALDGTWRQARRMIRRVPGLEALPRVTVSLGSAPPLVLRRRTVPGGMATAEALARLMVDMGALADGEALFEAWQRQVRAVLTSRGLAPEERLAQLAAARRQGWVAEE